MMLIGYANYISIRCASFCCLILIVLLLHPSFNKKFIQIFMKLNANKLMFNHKLYVISMNVYCFVILCLNCPCFMLCPTCMMTVPIIILNVIVQESASQPKIV